MCPYIFWRYWRNKYLLLTFQLKFILFTWPKINVFWPKKNYTDCLNGIACLNDIMITLMLLILWVCLLFTALQTMPEWKWRKNNAAECYSKVWTRISKVMSYYYFVSNRKCLIGHFNNYFVPIFCFSDSAVDDKILDLPCYIESLSSIVNVTEYVSLNTQLFFKHFFKKLIFNILCFKEPTTRWWYASLWSKPQFSDFHFFALSVVKKVMNYYRIFFLFVFQIETAEDY